MYQPKGDTSRIGITTRDNQFCDILAHRFDSDPSLEDTSNVSAFYILQALLSTYVALC